MTKEELVMAAAMVIALEDATNRGDEGAAHLLTDLAYEADKDIVETSWFLVDDIWSFARTIRFLERVGMVVSNVREPLDFGDYGRTYVDGNQAAIPDPTAGRF